MTALALFQTNIEGEWLGKAETTERADLVVRLGVSSLCMGELQRLQLEVMDAKACELVLAALCMVALAPAQGPAAGMWSSISGAYTMALTPDDEGVLALSGCTPGGNPVSFTLLRAEDDTLQLTLLWRVSPAEAQPHRIAASLRRLQPVGPVPRKTARRITRRRK